MMSAADIIKQDLARGGFTKHEKQFFTGLKNLINAGRAEILRHENTLVVLLPSGEGVAEMHFYTVDPLPIVRRALPVFHAEIKRMGLKKLVGQTESPALIGIAKGLGFPLQVAKNLKGYVVTLEVD